MRSFIQNIAQALIFVWQSSHRWMVAQIVLLILQTTLPLVNLFLLKRIVDKASFFIGKKDFQSDLSLLFTDLLLFGFVLLFMSIVDIGMQLVSEVQEQLVSDFMEAKVFQKSITLDLAFYENPQYQDNLHQAQADVQFRPIAVLRNLTSILQSFLSLLFLSAIFLFIHWSIGFLLFLLVIPALFIKAHYSKKLFQWQKNRIELQRKAYYLGNILSATSFAKEIRLFNIGESLIHQLRSIRQKLIKEKLYILWQRSIASFFIVALEVAVLLMAYGLIAYQAGLGLVTIGALVMYFQAVHRGQLAVNQMVLSVGLLYQNRLFLSHIFDLLALKPTIKTPQPNQSISCPIKNLRFKGVGFNYPQTQQEVLKNINFEVQKGQIVAIVGQNGSGKTTLIKLLCRLYDTTKGTIQINGIDIKNLSLSDLRQNISIIFQDFAQYHFTVAENIYLSDAQNPKDEAALKKATQQTGADAFIQGFEKGYEQPLGRDFREGVELSGGQWQKIALSRAFYKNADIIVLDEPTSAIDPLAEHAIFSQLRQIAADKILILITHRLYNLKLADTIFVMQEGAIIERGNHEFLIKNRGLYWQMFEKQIAN
jgi:ATP-binding cassette, subfamily B, bacterial